MTVELFRQMMSEELEAIKNESAPAERSDRKFDEAVELFDKMTAADDFEDFF